MTAEIDTTRDVLVRHCPYERVSDIPQAEASVVAAEMARRQALSAMGVDVYVSRYDMPGAAPAVRQRQAQVKATEDASSDSSAREPKVKTANPTPAPRAEWSTNTERTATASTSSGVSPAKSSEAVTFSMLLASAGPFLWVEQLADGLLRQDQLALINAMARALSADVSVRQQQFDWPMRGIQHSLATQSLQSKRCKD